MSIDLAPADAARTEFFAVLGADPLKNHANIRYLHLERWQSGRMRPT